MQRFLPLRIAEAVNRLMGAETAILRDSDLASRQMLVLDDADLDKAAAAAVRACFSAREDSRGHW